ncbi:MAG: diguanylate cyclase [Anaerorhabdus sp.]|uniref:sensor domain-containing diguanylate cyclase n=1 Tax=Anaerorhabdus sp. TaxID=1872524 RepID=UPI002FC69DB6
MNLEQKALEFFAFLEENYYLKRDLSSVQKCLSDHISWIGTGVNEVCSSLEEAEQALANEVKEYSGTFTISDSDVNYVELSSNLCVIFGSLIVTPQSIDLAEENLRFSVVLKDADGEMQVEHIHFSHPDLMQGEDSYFTPKSRMDNCSNLKEKVDVRRRQLEILTKNIPGGAHQCLDDASLTILSMSDGFLNMVGYTREEIKTLFGDKFMNLIYPEDRAKVLHDIQAQDPNKSELELEYRLYHKTTQPIWILDKCRRVESDGKSTFYCILIENTDRKREQEALRLSLERYQVVINQTTDIVFEWDVLNDTLIFSNNFIKKFGYDAISSEISHRLILTDNIHPSDKKSLSTIMRQCLSGVPYSETELRIKKESGSYLWCRIRVTTQFNDYRQPVKVIGIIVDINDEKKQKQKLLDQAQRDPLTGLYNKSAICSVIESCIKDNTDNVNQALLILDIDYFKNINDTYGHLTGDRVLSEVAKALKNATRSTDFVGRIGGDEFIIFLPEVTTADAVIKKANAIVNEIRKLRPFTTEKHLTCSIGISITSSPETNYTDLYQQADEALYTKKSEGRDGCSLFDSQLHLDLYHSWTKLKTDGNLDNNYTKNYILDQGLAQYCFRTLFSSKDFEGSLTSLLEIIGRSFDVSRTYVFESSDDYNHVSMTYEWCNDGIEPQINHLQDYSYVEDLDDYKSNFNNEGLFIWSKNSDTGSHLQELLESQNIKSMLQCAVFYQDDFLGGIGFDECLREDREWTDAQINSFKLTTNVLSTFLVQHRMLQYIERLIEDKQSN